MLMFDLTSIFDFLFSSLLSFTNLFFSTYPLSLAASLAVLVLVFKLYQLLM